VRIVARRLVCSGGMWYNSTVSCRKTGNRSKGDARHRAAVQMSRLWDRRGQHRAIRSCHMLGGVSCVIPLGIPVASTGHARGAAFSFPREGGKVEMATKGTIAMKRNVKFLIAGAVCCTALGLLAAPLVQHYYCKYCGHKTTSVNSLTSSPCQRHPSGPGKGHHALYEGGEKESYVCKYCGLKSTSIASLTSSKCQRHPNGPQNGRHAPAL